jgi:hypothetical protein
MDSYLIDYNCLMLLHFHFVYLIFIFVLDISSLPFINRIILSFLSNNNEYLFWFKLYSTSLIFSCKKEYISVLLLFTFDDITLITSSNCVLNKFVKSLTFISIWLFNDSTILLSTLFDIFKKIFSTYLYISLISVFTLLFI